MNAEAEEGSGVPKCPWCGETLPVGRHVGDCPERPNAVTVGKNQARATVTGIIEIPEDRFRGAESAEEFERLLTIHLERLHDDLVEHWKEGRERDGS